MPDWRQEIRIALKLLTFVRVRPITTWVFSEAKKPRASLSSKACSARPAGMPDKMPGPITAPATSAVPSTLSVSQARA